MKSNETHVMILSWKAGKLDWWVSKGEFGGVAIVAATLPQTPEPLPTAMLPEAVVDETPLPTMPWGTASE